MSMSWHALLPEHVMSHLESFGHRKSAPLSPIFWQALLPVHNRMQSGPLSTVHLPLPDGMLFWQSLLPLQFMVCAAALLCCNATSRNTMLIAVMLASVSVE